MKAKINRVGETYTTNEGYRVVIVEYFNANDCTIGFEDGHLAKKVKFGEIKRGEIKNNFHRSVFGIGYFGVGLAKSSIKSKLITPYITWLNMMKRCYDKEYQKKKQPTYIGCIVCDEWHNFNTFNTWFNENYIDGFAIDKDIIIKNNKIYSPETCCFVPKSINLLFTNRKRFRGNTPIGVSINPKSKKYHARVRINNKEVLLGIFDCPIKAFNAYKIAKEAEIKRVAYLYKDSISHDCFNALLNYNVEITD